MKTGTFSACLGEGMEIKARDHHEWRLRIVSVDDLWVLQRILRPGMSVGMLGERRDQTTGGEEGGRSKQAERKKMWIQLSVGKTEHQSFTDTLRIHGTIMQAPIDIGMHHTHVVELRDEVVLTAQNGFSKLDRDLLDESIKASEQGQVALLVVEGDEVILFFVTGRGLRESATWTMRGGGKRGDLRQREGIASRFRQTIVDGLTQQLEEGMPLVICGPGKSRDRMLADLKAAGHRRTMMSVGTTMGGRGAANDVLRNGSAGALLAEHHMVKEVSMLQEAWGRISTNGAVAYGSASILKAVKEGAVETLLLGADLLRDENEDCDGTPWATVVGTVETFSGTVIQCSSDHDDGEQLLGFGGAVALLRYRM
jgi:mRNA surveillance protein pelota